MIYKLPDYILNNCKAGIPVVDLWFKLTQFQILSNSLFLVKQYAPLMLGNLNMGLNKLICNRNISVQPTDKNALLGRDLPQTLTNIHPNMQLEIDERYATQHR